MFEQSVLDSISVITHSGIRIGGEKNVYIDPVSVNGAPHDADLILFTHPHFDHFSPRDAKKIMNDNTVIAAPKSMAAMCKLLLGRDTVSLLPDEKREICGIPIETVPAYNKAKPFHIKPMKWLGYVLTIGDTRVYVSGDTDITDECSRVSCDILLLPIGGFYTVDPVQAAELANKIAPHAVIPIHYGKLLGGEYAPDRFVNALDNNIKAEIRPSAFSNILVSMYIKIAALAAAAALLGFFAGKLI